VPNSQPLAASRLDPEPVSPQARVPLLSRFPLPFLHPNAENGQGFTVGTPGKPLLIVLWAEWCQPCLTELQSLQAHSAELSKAGLNILALSVDEAAENSAPDARAKSLATARRLGLTLPLAWAAPSDLEILEVLQRTLIDTHLPLPLPSSFLLDSKGRVACIYKGAVEPQQLQTDLGILDAGTDELLRAASPFPGRRTRKPAALGPIQLALKLYEGGYSRLTRDYLRQLIEIAETRAPGHEALDRAELHYFMGTLLEEAGRPQDAVHAYNFALRAEPDHTDSHRNLGGLLLKEHQPGAAIPHLEAAAREAQADGSLHQELGRAYYQTGKSAEAVALLRTHADSTSANSDALRLLIWILSTDPNPEIRNGSEALRLAESLLAAAGPDPDTATLSAAAAAAAESGDTARAESLARQALERAGSAPGAVKQRLEAQIQSYAGGKPWRELGP
jgi:tetratricopeptide (TPR) repeat protein